MTPSPVPVSKNAPQSTLWNGTAGQLGKRVEQHARVVVIALLVLLVIATAAVIHGHRTLQQAKGLTNLISDRNHPTYDMRCQYQDSKSNHPCLCQKMHHPHYPIDIRPHLMIVIVETRDREGRPESEYVIDNFQRYCKLHNCIFKYVLVDADVMYVRWKLALDYWHSADWLLMIDSDNVVSNLTNSVEPYLDVPEHVVLHLRLNREVTAGIVAFRTSDFGRCFLQRWIDLMALRGMYGRLANADNGALLLAVAEYLHTGLAKQLADGTTEIFEFISNFELLFPYLAQAHKLAPIRIYMPLSGFWREHHDGVAENFTPSLKDKCNFDHSVQQAVYHRCWWNDVFAAGWKLIGTNMWANVSANATLAHCTFNSPDESLEIAKLCCYDHFPGCIDHEGANVCRMQPWCQNPQAGPRMQVRADIGFGVCFNHKPWDRYWRPSPLLGKKAGC